MNIKDMKKKAQSALLIKYGFKPSINSIVPLETNYEDYFMFRINNVMYQLNESVVTLYDYL